MTTKSAKHSNKAFGSEKDKAAKAVDIRKVAALSVGAAGVIAGAAIAFGATPAMAAEATSTPVNPSAPANTQNLTAKNDDSKTSDDSKQQVDEKKQTDETNQNEQTVVKIDNTEGKTDVKSEGTTSVNKQAETPAPVDQNRASNGDTKEVAFSSQTGEMPNVYGFGTVDNQYDEQLANNPIIFKLPKQKDTNGADKDVTRVTVFPSPKNHINTPKTSGSIDFDSANDGHQPYSGEYVFEKNKDGSATLTMNRIFRKDERGDSKGIKNAQGYSATRSIQINPIPVQGSAKEDAVSDQFRAALLVPPKSAGTIVKKVSDADITDTDVNNAMDYAKKNGKTTHVGKSGIDGLSLEAQIQALSKVGNRKLDTIADKIPTKSNEYDKSALTKANSKVGVSIVNTHFVTDLGFKSQDIPLTIVRYNDVIDKPIVDDPNSISEDVKKEIAQKLAKINSVNQNKITFDEAGNAVIHFDGLSSQDDPKIPLSDLVLTRVATDKVAIPSDSDTSTVKAVVVANPLGYSKAELKQIKKAIYEANKDNQELGLSGTDYEKQISLGWIEGNLQNSGKNNQGISNGQSENTITVTIRTDKAYAQFKSDIKEHQLTRLIDLRKDYTLSWDADKNKINGRASDEGLAWMENGKTLVYRYDPDSGATFNTKDVLELLKATVNADVAKANPQLRKELLGTEYQSVTYEGKNGAATRSHVGYIVDANGEPIGVLNLSKLNGSSYGGFAKPVDNSNKKMGDEQSSVNVYTFDKDSQKVSVAGKKDKCMIGRLFIEPYTQYQYNYIYGEGKYNPRTSPKGINVVFVPQTNHKTKDLSDSIGEHKTESVDGKDVPTQSKYYNASDKKKEAYDEALKTAKTLYGSVKDTDESKLTEDQKAQIDNATINLNKAREALDGDATKKEELNKSINEDGTPAPGQQATTGTKASDKYKNVTEPDFKKADGSDDTERNNAAENAKTAYDEALAEAEKVKADDYATQKAVDDAKAKLDAARKELDKYSTSKDKLNAAIAEHGKAKYVEDAQGAQTLAPAYQNATDDERTAYDDAVKKANELAKDPNASQKEVNAAIEALEAAKKALDAKATDKSKLITAEKLSFDNPDPDKTDGKKSTFYKNAFDKQTSGDNDQEKQAAKTAVDNYNNALKKAREVLKNDKATQAEVDAAKEALTNAEKVLHEKYASNADELTKVLADNFSGYLMPAYFNAFDKAHAGDKDAAAAFKNYNDAYHKAKELKKNFEATDPSKQPTATDIADAKKALEEARKVIDKYATNTSRLSAAVFNDIAIQHSPAYANVKELANKQNPSREEKAQVDAAKKAKEAYEAAVAKLNQALNKQMPKDKQGNTEIPTSNPPEKDIDVNNANALDNIQAHAQGEPLDRDITNILKEMNDAIADLNKFATKTDDLLKSVNEHDNTKQTPAYKNTEKPDYKGKDGTTADADKNAKASKARDDYDKALDAAKKLLKKPDATQKEVNDALKKLDDARTALDAYKTDVSKLQESANKHGKEKHGETAAIEGTVTSDAYRNASDPHFMKADKTNPTKLVEDTKKNEAAKKAKADYDKALAKAQELLKKANPENKTPLDEQPTQKQIDAALTKLDTARKTLEDTYKTNTDALSAEAAKSTAEGTDFENSPEFKNADDKKGEGNKDNDDVAAYKRALKDARDLLAKKNSTTLSERPTQQQINDALDALKQAKKQITDNYKTKVDDLKTEVGKDSDFTKTPEYQNAAGSPEVEAYKKALEDAKKVLGDKNATQAQVDDALKKLQEAKKNLADSHKTDKTKLQTESNADGDFTKTPEYQNAAGSSEAEAYKKALDEANKVLANKDATQAQIDEALKNLKQAKDDLTRKYKTDKTNLNEETGNDSDFRKSIPFLIADGKDIAEYNKALNDANAVLADPNATQAQIDEALRKLQRIKQKMIDFYNSLGSGSDDDSDGNNNGNNGADNANNANANAVDKSMLQAEVNGALADVANGAGAKVANGVNASIVKELNDALENARRVLADSNATREQVEAATMRLRAARAALNAAKANKGSNSRGNMGVQTGVDSATLSAFAAVFVGLAGFGVSAKRRKHSSR
ncbi:peptidase [Gardnerella vaginalis]|uniref:peptidase n=1 Tax=Gardnerella vaginalis TaxID=2702 RepID=UPI0039F05F58